MFVEDISEFLSLGGHLTHPVAGGSAATSSQIPQDKIKTNLLFRLADAALANAEGTISQALFLISVCSKSCEIGCAARKSGLKLVTGGETPTRTRLPISTLCQRPTTGSTHPLTLGVHRRGP